MEAKGRIRVDGPNGMDGPGNIVLGTDRIELRPSNGTVKVVSLRDIVKVRGLDHQIYLDTLEEGTVLLSMLGNRYDDLLRELHRTWNELSLQDRLMQESQRRQGVRCQCQIVGRMSPGYQGAAEIRLYSTALVIMPENDNVRRILYSDIIDATSAEEALSVRTERGCTILLSRLGKELGPLHRDLSAAVQETSGVAQSLLKQLCPTLSPAQLASASRLMAEGKAARRGDVEAISKELWAALELRMEGMGMGEEYRYLESICERGSMRVGIKKGLRDDAEYIWMLAPVIKTPDGGNAIAFEATSEEGEGRATYVFRMMSAKDLPSIQADDFPASADRSAQEVAAALMAINFRREPIYIGEIELAAPGREAYQNAVRAMPELRLLRRSFAGRVVHTSPEQWKQDMEALLAFCASSIDGQRWTPPPS